MSRAVKQVLTAPLAAVLRATGGLREQARRLWSFASLAAALTPELPLSTVVLGSTHVYGSRRIHFGNSCLLYPDQHLETQDAATITLGDGCVLSRGVPAPSRVRTKPLNSCPSLTSPLIQPPARSPAGTVASV